MLKETKTKEVPAGEQKGAQLLTEKQLAERWVCSTKKLQKDRVAGTGIPFLKLGGMVRYAVRDIAEHEEEARRTSTSDAGIGQ